VIDQGGSLIAAAAACGIHRAAALEAARGVARAVVFVIAGRGLLSGLAAQCGRAAAHFPAIVCFAGFVPVGGVLERTKVAHAYGADRGDLDVLIIAGVGVAVASQLIRRPAIDAICGDLLVLNAAGDFTPPLPPGGVDLSAFARMVR